MRSLTILSGTHNIHSIVEGDHCVMVDGIFEGTFSNTADSRIAFIDHFRFNGGLVDHRITTFPMIEI